MATITHAVGFENDVTSLFCSISIRNCSKICVQDYHYNTVSSVGTASTRVLVGSNRNLLSPRAEYPTPGGNCSEAGTIETNVASEI